MEPYKIQQFALWVKISKYSNFFRDFIFLVHRIIRPTVKKQVNGVNVSLAPCNVVQK